ncbi:sulfurtransferase complex subunit TusB [Morganella psychrotolerans]|uniref:tRNA 2-thiouridine(34) synthase TusB n=1 Tax=Morganella psychrotolerans TaxID=368603 RepID=A0A1B8H3A0_9GAMM|nr:sulfurtransferase complex subunit TusB [Morganella psychrotolerans]OBU03540.1 tRNA 2-thiouridine(34) synthase TusB [Morganella psychrotolerans]
MLYTVSQSPFRTDIQSLLNLLSPGDDILFTEDGVIAATNENPLLPALIQSGHIPCVLREDAQARGLLPYLSGKVRIIDYNGFIELTVIHTQHFAWE